MGTFLETTGNVKKLFLSLFVIGAISAVIGGSTFANFNAQTTNPGNTFGAGTLTMTNVAGTALNSTSNCTASTYSGTCATIFAAGTGGTTGLTDFKPGGSDVSNTVTITYTGSLTTNEFKLYATSYTSKAAGSSGTLCTASDPASKIDLQIMVGSTIIYPLTGSYGTLADFATTYTSSSNGLALNGGTNGAGSAGVWATSDSGAYTIKVHLNSSADNAYQGCQSVATLNWYAGQ